MKFIHISDLHFHRRKVDNKKVLATLTYIKHNYPSHNLIVTGDIVDDGHEKQFDQAYTALKPFKGKIYICPGNHDFGAAGNFYSRERAERFDRLLSESLNQGGTFTGDTAPVVNVLKDRSDQVMLIALDTNLETKHPFDFACGEVGEGQLAALDNILSNPASANFTKILFCHHHPFMHGNAFMELLDARELIRTIYNKVEVLLFGHKHASADWQNNNGIEYILAADNSPGKNYAREISVNNKKVTVKDIKIA
jgi:3',5'-cyclic AMP phosphodiesterase CpdA